MRCSSALWISLLLALSFGRATAQPWGASGESGGGASQLALLDTEARAVELRLAQASSEEARAEAEIVGLEERAEEARGHVRDRVRALYRIRRAGALPIAGGFSALLSHMSRIERLERIVRADVNAMRFFGERRAGLRTQADRARQARLAAEREKQSLDQRRQSLRAELGSYAYMPDEALPSLPLAPLPVLPSYGTLRVVDTPAEAEVGFRTQRGRLGLPVAGAARIRDAVRDDGPGLELLTAAGTPVQAVADGRVAFARTYGSYGRLVILDHGGSYYTVYGGLGRVDARVGDSVVRGGSIGTVGAASEPALFFEVRQGTRSLDARAWAGL